MEFAKKKKITGDDLARSRRCQVEANFASIKISKQTIYHYTIEIKIQDHASKADKNINQRNAIRQQKRIANSSNLLVFRKLVTDNFELFNKCWPVFDGKQNFYNTKPLNFEGSKTEVSIRFRPPSKRVIFSIFIFLEINRSNLLSFSI